MPIARPLPSSSRARATGTTLPRPSQLAALGTVLCLYRPALGHELDGWQHAVEAAACRQLDSDGVREGIWFFDAEGHCCWRLYLLPDSDFLDWDRLVSRLPPLSMDAQATGAGMGLGERLWRRLAGRMRGETWRLSALRLSAGSGRAPPLAASLATVSALGAVVAARVAHDEGIEARVAVDDCCCARAAALRSGPTPAGSDPAAMTSALLRLRR
ncbi:Hemin transport protein [Xanthomonas axonopodis pv. poinsettiicola]|uniref:Hemin transport protein n=1 Tax=Xanthomonas TaxID=338 RepID=UPI001E3F9940|nr:Hemin transport protein [Xanthomonas codiaei]MCC8539384.1 Hemin transport protein [Xanthomonas codiaei]